MLHSVILFLLLLSVMHQFGLWNLVGKMFRAGLPHMEVDPIMGCATCKVDVRTKNSISHDRKIDGCLQAKYT
jgi:hypothetical protein